jgi:hypothetical protein
MFAGAVPWLCVGDEAGGVALWGGEQPRIVHQGGAAVTAMARWGSDRVLVGFQDGAVVAVDATGVKPLRGATEDRVAVLDVAANGNEALALLADGRIVSCLGGAPVPFDPGANFPSQIGCCGDRLVVGLGNATIVLAGGERKEVGWSEGAALWMVRDLVPAANGLWVGGYRCPVVVVVGEAKPGQVPAVSFTAASSDQASHLVRCLAASDDGGVLVTGHVDGAVQLWRGRRAANGPAATAGLLREERVPAGGDVMVRAVAISPNGDRFAMVRDGTLVIEPVQQAAP